MCIILFYVSHYNRHFAKQFNCILSCDGMQPQFLGWGDMEVCRAFLGCYYVIIYDQIVNHRCRRHIIRKYIRNFCGNELISLFLSNSLLQYCNNVFMHEIYGFGRICQCLCVYVPVDSHMNIVL